jgi:VanZ family protein
MKVKITFKNFVKYYLPVIFWMGFIFWLSTETFSSPKTFSFMETALRFFFPEISPREADLIHAMIRKSGHVMEYFILGLLLLRAFRGGSIGPWNWRRSFFAVILVALCAAGDEFHQSFVSTRTASVLDVVLDIAGGVLAQFAIIFWLRYRKK